MDRNSLRVNKRIIHQTTVIILIYYLESSPSWHAQIFTKSDNLGEILSFYLCEESVDRGSQL